MLCEDPDRTKELSETIAKTLKINLGKIDLPDNANNASASKENDRKQKDRKRAEADSALETVPKQLKDSDLESQQNVSCSRVRIMLGL